MCRYTDSPLAYLHLDNDLALDEAKNLICNCVGCTIRLRINSSITHAMQVENGDLSLAEQLAQRPSQESWQEFAQQRPESHPRDTSKIRPQLTPRTARA